jgi:plastocyanin
LAIGLVTAALFAACGGDGLGDVQMQAGQKFEPATIEVKVGAEVTWYNASSESHTVTAYEDSLPSGADYFDSGGAGSEAKARDDVQAGLIAPGDSFSVRFQVPGTYRYFCIPHESSGMKGTIVVKG